MRDLLQLSSESLSSLGVLDWGYTEEPVPRSFDRFSSWLDRDWHGPLDYLADHRRELRSDLRQVLPGFRSALVFLFSYQPTKKWMIENDQHAVAAYTLGFGGVDYHYAVRDRMLEIAQALGLSGAMISLDQQAVLERDLAYRAGLGWFGKNSLLIHPKEGSYFIIGSLLLPQTLPLSQNELEVDHCGQCLACVDACPTAAIDPESRTLVAEKCISTFTIEVFKDTDPPVGYEKSRGEVFGCDICQDVCPWNRKPLTRVTGELRFREDLAFLKDWFFSGREKLQQLMSAQSNRGFINLFKKTVFNRPGRAGWLKNFKSYFQPK